MSSKSKILQGLGSGRLLSPPPQLTLWEDPLSSHHLPGLLARRLGENGATCLLTQDDSQSVETVADMLFDWGVDRAVIGTEALLREMKLLERLQAKLPKIRLRNAEVLGPVDSWEGVDFAVTGCAALLARTGTIIMPGPSRLSLRASLLPPNHIVVARRNQIFEDLDSWLQALPPSAHRLSWVTIAGPSRTADIEKRIVLGVHGPRRVSVMVAVGQLYNFQPDES